MISRAATLGLVLVLAVACESRMEVDHPETSIEKAAIEQANQMVKLLNAVTNWDEGLEDEDLVLTVNVESAILRSRPRPILFVGSIDDVFRNNDKYYVAIDSWRYPSDIVGLFECDPAVTKRLVAAKPDGVSNYALVVQPTSLERLLWGAWSDVDTDDVYLSNERVLLLRGQLVDFTPLGFADYEPD